MGLRSVLTHALYSIAAPHVTGVLACLLSSELSSSNGKRKPWTVDDVRKKLETSFSRETDSFKVDDKTYKIRTIFNKLEAKE